MVVDLLGWFLPILCKRLGNILQNVQRGLTPQLPDEESRTKKTPYCQVRRKRDSGMKMIKCDLCGKVEDSGSALYSFETNSFYMSRVVQYRLGETADIHKQDLCQKHQAELDAWVNEFMKGDK